MASINICKSCQDSFNSQNKFPLILPCQHLVCSACIFEQYFRSNNYQCPFQECQQIFDQHPFILQKEENFLNQILQKQKENEQLISKQKQRKLISQELSVIQMEVKKKQYQTLQSIIGVINQDFFSSTNQFMIELSEQKQQIDIENLESFNISQIQNRKNQELLNLENLHQRVEKELKLMICQENEKLKQTQEVKPLQTQKSLNSSQQQFSFVNPRKSLVDLTSEYRNYVLMDQKLLPLLKNFDSYRQIKSDGNNLYRAIGIGYLEHLCRYSTPYQHLQDFINRLESRQGYYQIRPNDLDNSHLQLRETLMKLLKNLLKIKLEQREAKDINLPLKHLTQELEDNNDNLDEALVWQLRCFQANYLESHKDFFEPLLKVSYEDQIKDILTMGKGNNETTIDLLQIVLYIKIDIITIEEQKKKGTRQRQFQIAGKYPIIFMLLNQGHYDLIYIKAQSIIDGFYKQMDQLSLQKDLSGYNIDNPDWPFYINIDKFGQKFPLDEFKPFRTIFNYPYQYSKNYEDNEQNNQKETVQQLKKCEFCNGDIQIQDIIVLQCQHTACKYCLEDIINLKTQIKTTKKKGNFAQQIVCRLCQKPLTPQEIKEVIRKEKSDQTIQKAKQ